MAISVNHPDPAFGEPVERVDPALSGHPWWRYERPAVSLSTGEEAPPAETDGGRTISAPAKLGPEVPTPVAVAAPTPEPVPDGETRPPMGAGLAPSAVPGMVGVGALIFGTFIAASGMRLEHVGVVTFPLAAILAAVAFGKRCRRLRPDEPWLPRLILLGTLVKIGASAARYVTFAELYNSVGDAFVYDREAREMVTFWAGGRDTSPMADLPFTGSNVIRWLTAWLYQYFGQDLLAAFLLFGLLALLGSYFWYRALVDAVPYVDKRLFLIFVLFVPSVIFWPASLGKEALMQVALGAMAWATSLALRGRYSHAALLAVGGGIPLYFIRPHLLALATVAAAVPFVVGRARGSGAFVAKPATMLAIGLLVIFTVTAGTRFVGLESLSLDSVEENLDEQTAATSYGGSSFAHTGNSLTNPLFLPIGIVTVLFRPFIFEASGLLPLMTAVESTILLALVFLRRDSILLALRRCRSEPFLLYCLLLLVFYSAAFSALANFGLLTRQRSLVLPAIYALVALSPRLARRSIEAESLPSVERLVALRVPPLAVDSSNGLVRRQAFVPARPAGNGVHVGNGSGANGNGSGGNGHAPAGNGHAAGNGSGGNGHAPAGNGHATGNGNGNGNGNGEVGNGHAPAGNGHATGNGNGNATGNGNGEVGNGHAPAGNGHATGNGNGNGHATGIGNGNGNGHATGIGNGEVGNGHATGTGNGNGNGNGHAPGGNGSGGNGHASGNGDAPAGNGTDGNGHAPVEDGDGAPPEADPDGSGLDRSADGPDQ